MVNILFTSVGRRVELLRAFRCAYADMSLQGTIVALDIDPLAPALAVADRPYIVPRMKSPDYIPQLVEICRRESVQAVFPLIDPDIPLLAEHREAIEATGARLAVVPLEATKIASDKWITSQFFQSVGVPTPRSWLPEEVDPPHAQYPLFIKPRFGSASKQTFQIDNERELVFFSSYVNQPIIQECLTGPEITNDVVCDLSGDVLAVISRQRIEVRWGEVAKGITIYNPDITEACVKIAQALPALGPITVQCMMHEGIPYFTEINARFGGGVPLGIAAGVDSPRMLLSRLAGIPFEKPPLGSYQVGLYMSRFDESQFITQADYERMASHHL